MCCLFYTQILYVEYGINCIIFSHHQQSYQVQPVGIIGYRPHLKKELWSYYTYHAGRLSSVIRIVAYPTLFQPVWFVSRFLIAVLLPYVLCFFSLFLQYSRDEYGWRYSIFSIKHHTVLHHDYYYVRNLDEIQIKITFKQNRKHQPCIKNKSIYSYLLNIEKSNAVQ